MDNIPEREQPKPERVIQLNQEFHPFDPKYTVDRKPYFPRSPQSQSIESSIQLNLEGANFPLRIEASNYSNPLFNHWGQVMTPFDPELGYQIDYDDLNLATRREKINRLGAPKLFETIDPKKAPYLFEMFTIGKHLNEVGLNKKRGVDKFEFPKDTKDLLRKLRLHVFFPKLKFEGKISEYDIENGWINFSHFYPADSGPLAEGKYEDIGDEEWFTQESLFLFLPSDPEKLAQIRARFVLVEEEPRGESKFDPL